MEIIEPTTPLPITTTSTGLSFVAMLGLLDYCVFWEALCIDLRLSLLNIENTHRLCAVYFRIV